jgi:transcriptional regulator of aromatic amino acid metabolism
MRLVENRIHKLAKQKVAVLLTGESGVGKEISGEQGRPTSPFPRHSCGRPQPHLEKQCPGTWAYQEECVLFSQAGILDEPSHRLAQAFEVTEQGPILALSAIVEDTERSSTGSAYPPFALGWCRKRSRVEKPQQN